MEKAALEYRLRVAERRVAQGYADIKRQREFLADLVRDGHAEDAERASKLLVQYEDIQTSRVIDCGRLVEELKRIG